MAEELGDTVAVHLVHRDVGHGCGGVGACTSGAGAEKNN